MAQQAKVEDLEVFRRFRAAMLKFAQAADQALTGADSHISRTRFWLESEQMTYWQQQIRLRTEAVTIAAEEVRKKKMFRDVSGRTPDATQEQKALDRAKAALEVSKQKVEYIKKAMPALDRAADLYRGGVSRLRSTLSVEVPNSVMLLDRLAAKLEEYLSIEAPTVNMAEVAPLEAFDAIARAAEEAPEAPAPAADASPAEKEARDVAAGS